MDRIQFNTERCYTEHGQRVIGVKHNDRIYFHDIDRGIDGSFAAPDDMFGTVELNRTTIMSRYDSNHIEWIPRDTPQEVLDELSTWKED
jgi:hypothetical protein